MSPPGLIPIQLFRYNCGLPLLPAPLYPGRVAQRWGLVGRDDELELLRAALADTATRGAVLSGAAGVGKTRLASELLEHAGRQGWATAWTVGTRAMGTVPFGAFAHLLPATDIASSPLEVMHRAGHELRRRYGERPLVLAVDDAHLLDDASAGLTHQLVSNTIAFVVATVRRGEEVPDAIRSLWKDGLAERVELQALSRLEVGELLTAVLGGQVDTSTQHRLWEASRGNVLFVRELVLIGLERGALAEHHGIWSWTGALAGGDRLAELVEDRLAGLNRQQRSALEVLAVAEPLPASLFADTVGSRVVRALEAKGLLSVGADGRRSSLRLEHPLYAETLRADIGAVRRRAICRRLADVLAATGARRREDVLRLALWRLEDGGHIDPAVLLTAAGWAHSTFDHPLCERLARAALADGAGPAAGITLADALYWQGRHEQAAEVVGDHRPHPADQELVTQWAFVASAIYFWGQGDARRAEAACLEAEQLLDPGPRRDVLVGHRATMVFFNGRAVEALGIAEPLLARNHLTDEQRLRNATAAVPALALTGRCERAISVAADGLVAADTLLAEYPVLVGELLGAQTVAYLQAGRYQQMEELAAAAYQHVVAQQAHDLRGMWALLLGRAALARGSVRTARHRLREAAALLREQDPGGFLAWALCCWARAAAQLGDVGDAQAALEEQQRARNPAIRIFDADVVLARAWRAAAVGEHSSARRLALQAAALARGAGQRCGQLDALHEAVRFGEPGLAPQLSRLLGSVDNVLAAQFAAHAAALEARDGAALDRCAATFGELGVPLLAAEAAVEAAEAHHRDGDSSRRLASLEHSRAFAVDCEGARTPVLLRARTVPSLRTLSAREREVGEFAAHGMSKREIAGRLVLSVRTVGNHLNHIYTKLGITGRAELAVLFELDTPDPVV